MLAHHRAVLIAITFFLVVSCSFYLFGSADQSRLIFERLETITHDATGPLRPTSNLRNTILSLFAPIKHDPTNPEYVDPSGLRFQSRNQSIWKKPLGKKILIVDIDTRVPTGQNQILNPALMDWENLELEGGGLVSNAIMNHYLYAMIHGYDYKFYQAQHMKDRHDTWIMPHVFRELLPDYQFVVAMDADATIPHLEVPLEWMFNRWGIHKHTSIAMPWDTEEFIADGSSISRDSKGLRVLNTGFVVAQNSETTLEMLEAWRDCPSEERYPGCKQWAYNWSHEQRAFSEYIRYDFNKTAETIVSIPCDDAVGWPGFLADTLEGHPYGISECNGRFVSHYTIGKDKVKAASSNSVMQALTDVIQKSLLTYQEQLWYKEPKKEKEPNADLFKHKGKTVSAIAEGMEITSRQ
ncbi:hypothetical protein LEMA_P031630.1 [Plenodomus lingam JN3]|uniref:Nucleotide-diphospho-sugar transferase domain-containing protein n=2 Tax=Leptosphaeria maculans TaxID=5022 RepID=E4ZWN5_LEPMJ|nr:hypothetical protein LEMA_P031630.1 [Plenodomus lingam JN3]CBX96011.1 hypothetical protein LEMA_P031630.1 [Plenodomus lingam JN3]